MLSPTGYSNYLECPNEVLSKEHEYKYSQFLTIMESFDCAGICVQPKYFMFSDVNKGRPMDLCKDKALEYSNKYAT